MQRIFDEARFRIYRIFREKLAMQVFTSVSVFWMSPIPDKLASSLIKFWKIFILCF